MRPSWESELAQFKSAEGRITTELKNKIIERVAKKKRIMTFLRYSSRIGVYSVVCFILFLQKDVIIHTIQNISENYQSSQPSQYSESEESIELLSLIEDIPIYPGLKKEKDTLYTYHIKDTSLITLMSYYDWELEERNWKSYYAEYGVKGSFFIKTWSNDKLLIELKFYKKEKNVSSIQLTILPRELNKINH